MDGLEGMAALLLFRLLDVSGKMLLPLLCSQKKGLSTNGNIITIPSQQREGVGGGGFGKKLLLSLLLVSPYSMVVKEW